MILQIAMPKGRLEPSSYGFLLLAATFLVILHTCNAQQHFRCYSSCGNIHNITYPFRLRTDPPSCGNKTYELACERNRTVLYVYPEKFYVQSINYNNFTIRLLDAALQREHNCSSFARSSLPNLQVFYRVWINSLSVFWGKMEDVSMNRLNDAFDDWGVTFPGDKTYTSLVVMNCKSQMDSPFYAETSSCTNATFNSSTSMLSRSDVNNYYYVNVVPVEASDLTDTCRVEMISVTSLLPKKVVNGKLSFINVVDSVEYGFELSWYWPCCCLNYLENRCNLNDTQMQPCLYSVSGGSSYPRLRSILVFLDSRLGKLLDRMESRPALYARASLSYYLVTLLRYVVYLFVLIRAPLFGFGSLCLIVLLIYTWRRRHLSNFQNVENFLDNNNYLMPIRYSYSEIKKMTKGFKDKLGEGGYGSVYKGKLRSGRFAAIKLLGKSKSNGQDFINEVATIGRIHHVNVVRLIGFCVEGSKRALVYELMPNGSLDKYIFCQESRVPLSIRKMYEISLGVAQGIEYLHRGCDVQILHFDIKPHNILLDENFIPKVSDFGLARSYPTDNSIISLKTARGTLGYMAPEFFYRSVGGISYKADVYGFGKLLMEMATRMKNFDVFGDDTSDVNFTWVHEQLNDGNNLTLHECATEEERQLTKKMIIIALWCIQLKPIDRPSMHKVVAMLEGDIENLEIPPKPIFGPGEVIKEDDSTKGTNSLSYSNSDSVSLLMNSN